MADPLNGHFKSLHSLDPLLYSLF